jgi:hypothetical protein
MNIFSISCNLRAKGPVPPFFCRRSCRSLPPAALAASRPLLPAALLPPACSRLFENKINGPHQQREGHPMIPSELDVFEENQGEQGKYDQRDDFLDDL